MLDAMYPQPTREIAQTRRDLAPGAQAAFDAFSRAVFEDGALSAKVKQIVAMAVAHVTQCPYCIKGHTKAALHAGATPQELMEAVWVAAEMRAGGAYAHWRQRIGPERLGLLLAESLAAAQRGGAVKEKHFRRVTIDTTVQPNTAECRNH